MPQAIRNGESLNTTISFYLLRKNKNEKLVEKYLALCHKQQNKNHIILTSHKNYQISSNTEPAIQ
jgi:hypothetical protein